MSVARISVRAMINQPSFEDLGQLLAGVTFCVVDLETTGSTEDDRITEFGAIKVSGGAVLGEFQTLVDPGTHIPPLVAVLTGITDGLVASAPTLPQVMPAFVEFARGCVLVAHNAGFDIGFLRRACAALDYPWWRPTVLDTVALARCIMLRDEVPNHRLATLARHFRAATTPNHRALDDARATVDVLHGLIERVGNLGVHTLEDLQEFSRQVSPQRRSRRTWADGLPERPGVYWFVREGEAGGEPDQILYVGKSVNLRRRVRSYFTAAEKRRRMEEMVRVATKVESLVCETALQSEVTELRLIAAHAPRYNRRSKFPSRLHWVKITEEPLPRLSIVRQVRGDQATYFGPVRQRPAAEEILAAVYDAFPIRQCTDRLRPAAPISPCALAGMGRCCAPCDGSVPVADYLTLVEAVRAALTGDIRPILTGAGNRLARLVAHERFEEAASVRHRLETVLATGRRMHRVGAVARCAEIVAAARNAGGWDIHVIRWGRLAGAAHADPHDMPQAVARSVVLTAETVDPPPAPLPAATVEETERIADWLECPGVRIIEITGDWFWPVNALISTRDLPIVARGEPLAC